MKRLSLDSTHRATGSALARLEDALRAHGSTKAGEGSWTCPGHDDDTPSLSVRQGDLGAVLKCHAGCENEDIVKALGITMADLFDSLWTGTALANSSRLEPAGRGGGGALRAGAEFPAWGLLPRPRPSSCPVVGVCRWHAGCNISVRTCRRFVNPVRLGSLDFASKVSGSGLVLGHTECGAIKGACDGVMLGNVTKTLSYIHPAMAAVKNIPFRRDGHDRDVLQRNDFLVYLPL